MNYTLDEIRKHKNKLYDLSNKLITIFNYRIYSNTTPGRVIRITPITSLIIRPYINFKIISFAF